MGQPISPGMTPARRRKARSPDVTEISGEGIFAIPPG